MRILVLACSLLAFLATSLSALSQEAGKPTTRISKSKKVEEKIAAQQGAEEKAAAAKGATDKSRRFPHQKKK
jgi:hypothetical protein